MTESGVVFRWWERSAVPPHLPITQVYGWLLDDAGRVLVLDDAGRCNLPGGAPEAVDGGLVGTLLREVMEEARVEVDDAVYLGFQEVRRPSRASYAQVRMAARIRRFHASRPDPDGGRTYGRLLTSLDSALDMLGWGQPAAGQAAAVAGVAASRWALPVTAPTLPAAYVP